MKVTERFDALHGRSILIEIKDSEVPLTRAPSHIFFWQLMDKIASQMPIPIPPFCPCGERPHRIACPLGFENYFVRQEPVSGGRSL